MDALQNARSLPDDHNTLRFYLDGVDYFLRWAERQIAVGLQTPSNDAGRLFLVLQQVLEPNLTAGDGKAEAARLAENHPSLDPSEEPFAVSPAFLGIQPFLDSQDVLARLKVCRDSAEAFGPIPLEVHASSILLPKSRRPRIGRLAGRFTAEERKQRETQRQKAESQRRRAAEEFRKKSRAALLAFRRLLDPFRALAQRIVLKLAGTPEPARPCGPDNSGFVPISLLVSIDRRVSTLKKLTRLVDAHPGKIRQRKPLSSKGTPHPQRREVYAADLIRFLRERDNEAFKTADTNPPVDDAGTLFSADAEETRRAIRRNHGLPETPYNSRPDLDRRD